MMRNGSSRCLIFAKTNNGRHDSQFPLQIAGGELEMDLGAIAMLNVLGIAGESHSLSLSLRRT